jgi:twinkle protein
MAEMITPDDIDFSFYEHETDAAQKVKPASLWVAELIERLKNPVHEVRSVMPWRKTHLQIQFRPGELTVWGGANGAGKSLVTGQVALSLCSQDEKVCIASFEMKPRKTLERMARQWSTYNVNDPAFYGNDEAKAQFIDLYEQFSEWTNGKLWLYDQQGTANAKQVCAVVRYCAKEKGITHFVIDSLMKCVSAEDDYTGQKMFIDELTAIARDYSIHVHVVHHVKKPADEAHKPGKYDFKGSGAITDQADNVIAVWRNKAKESKRDAGVAVADQEPDALLICDKQRNGEWEGKIGLWFDKNSMQYVASAGDSPLSLYKHPEH